MRCLIYARSEDAAWLKDYFPDIEAYLLKIVNKPLLEYAMDFFSLLGVEELRIVSDSSNKAIENFFKDGARWGVKTSYALAHPKDSLKTIYLKNISFCKNHDLLIWNGFFFLQFDKSKLNCAEELQKKFYSKNKRFIFLPKQYLLNQLSPEDEMDSSCFVTHSITNIVEYYRLSMAILCKHNKDYVLPGYSNEKDAFLGLNVVYPHSSEIQPPIMLGNNCRFQKNTLIGPNSIVGNNVIIDENTSVTDSIVYDNTYIGKDLDLDRKIVYKGNLINAENGELIQINDKVLVSQVELGIVTTFFNRTVQRILALILCLIQVIPWLLLFLPYRLFRGSFRSDRLLSKNLRSKPYTDAELLGRTPWGRFLVRLSLDKFDQILSAGFTRRIYLVGNRLLSNTVRHRNLIMDLPVYNPGAFSLAESFVNEDPDAELFHELEYIDRISTHYNIKILFRTLYNRLVYGCNCGINRDYES
jgi:hypothetical protein